MFAMHFSKVLQMDAESVFSCPYCSSPLSRGSHDYACGANHTFPIARSGYVNLAPAAKGGDTLTMLTARRRFLQAGHYRCLQEVIARTASRHLRTQAHGAPPVVADVGCGEGSHLAAVGNALESDIPAVRLVGLDLSKDAARMTAHRDGAWEVAVADVRRGLPLRENVTDVLLNVFAPRNAAAFSRALAPGGIALIVIPSEEHLRELREAVGLLRVEPMKLDRLVHQSAGRLALADVMSVDESRAFDVNAIEDVLAMTPNAWHLTEVQRRRAATLTRLTVTLSFRLVVFRKAVRASLENSLHWHAPMSRCSRRADRSRQP